MSSDVMLIYRLLGPLYIPIKCNYTINLTINKVPQQVKCADCIKEKKPSMYNIYYLKCSKYRCQKFLIPFFNFNFVFFLISTCLIYLTTFHLFMFIYLLYVLFFLRLFVICKFIYFMIDREEL